MAVNRVVRSTSVAIAEGRVPITRSPSQWPGTLRSSTSAGRSLLGTRSRMTPRPVDLAATFGRRMGRPVRSCCVRAWSMAWRRRGSNSGGRSPRARSAWTDHRGTGGGASPKSARATSAGRASLPPTHAGRAAGRASPALGGGHGPGRRYRPLLALWRAGTRHTGRFTKVPRLAKLLRVPPPRRPAGPANRGGLAPRRPRASAPMPRAPTSASATPDARPSLRNSSRSSTRSQGTVSHGTRSSPRRSVTWCGSARSLRPLSLPRERSRHTPRTAG